MARTRARPSASSSQDTTMDDVSAPTSASSSMLTSADDYPTPTSVHGAMSKPPLQTTTYSPANITSESSKLLDAINKLEMLGIDSSCIGHLPKIVAVGDQSAGKSSAIAAISGVTVPCSTGACTRCPSHIDLRTAAPGSAWSCTVSIEKRCVRYRNEWRESDQPEEILFAKLTDETKLEPILRRAQLAVLNPRDPPAYWLKPDANTQKEPEVFMSPNLIKISIAAPGYPNLTFYDLPGIFNQTGRNDQDYLPKEVKDLVQSYIAPENHIVLLACPMNVDPEVSAAAGLVKKGGALDRTIGLLTKPDCIPPGSPIQPWVDILQGRTFRLGHGYFVTKQPTQADLQSGMTVLQARWAESSFFDKPEWTSGVMAQFRERFGISKLQVRLSEILVASIRKSIPELHLQVDRRIEEITAELKLLPSPPGDRALGIVSSLLGEFRSKVKDTMKGEIPNQGFLTMWKGCCKEFSHSLLIQMRPTLHIRTRSEFTEMRARAKASGSAEPRTVVMVEDDSEGEMAPTPSKKRPPQSRPEPVTPTSVKRQKSAAASFDSQTSQVFLPNCFRLEELRNVREAYNTSGVSGTTDHRAAESLMVKSIEHWRPTLLAFINDTETLLEENMREILDALLEPWRNTPLAEELPRQMHKFIAQAVESEKEKANSLLDDELISPFTLNPSVERERETETKFFKDARRKSRASLRVEREEEASGKPASTGKVREEKIKKFLASNDLDTDEFNHEVEMMGAVRGYYNIAAASFVDTVCKSLRRGVFQACLERLVESIEAYFKVKHEKGIEIAKALLDEDPGRAERRAAKVKELEKFRAAKASIDALINPAFTLEERSLIME